MYLNFILFNHIFTITMLGALSDFFWLEEALIYQVRLLKEHLACVRGYILALSVRIAG